MDTETKSGGKYGLAIAMGVLWGLPMVALVGVLLLSHAATVEDGRQHRQELGGERGKAGPAPHPGKQAMARCANRYRIAAAQCMDVARSGIAEAPGAGSAREGDQDGKHRTR